MTLNDYLSLLRRRKWVIITTLVPAVAAALFVRSLLPPVYSASTTLRTPPASEVFGGTVRTDAAEYLDRLQNTYADLATSGSLRRALARRLGVSEAPEITVRGIPNSELMEIRAKASDADRAARAANQLTALLIAQVRAIDARTERAAAARFEARVKQLSQSILLDRREAERLRSLGAADPESVAQLAQLEADVQIKQDVLAGLLSAHEEAVLAREAQASSLSIVSAAVPPRSAARRPALLFALIGLLVGLVGGIGMALLYERLGGTLETREDIEAASQAPILGEFPRARIGEIVAGVNGRPTSDESFRRLVATLFPHGGESPRRILVTSATPGEGKSAVAANLGISLAEAGRSVVLVDANFRAPTLHNALGVANDVGLADVLEGEEPERALQALSVPNLFVVPSGQRSHDVETRLGSVRMERVLATLNDRFEAVIIDSPAILAVADALLVAPIVDGALLVVAEGKVTRQDVERASDQLKSAKGHLFGVVVNTAARVNGYRTGGRESWNREAVR